MEVVASEKKALEKVQTAESRDYIYLKKRHNALLGVIHGYKQTLDSLTDCLSVSGLADLRGDAFNEWLCDIGMSKLQTALNDSDGNMLTMLTVSDVMDYDVIFNDAAALLLRSYITHNKLNDGDFAPPRDSILSWDEVQTANWIDSLGDSYSSLSSVGWHGAALCSLSLPRVIEAGKGALKPADAIKFIGLVCQLRNETDGDKATWVAKWSGLIPTTLQAL